MDSLPFPYRIGRVSRAHGLRGELLVQLFRRRPNGMHPAAHRFRKLKQPMPIELEYETERLEPLEVTHAKWVDPIRLVVRLAGVDDRDGAEARVGCYFDVDPSRFDPAIADEVDRAFDAEVVDADSGERLGEVQAIRDNGAQALLEIDVGKDEPVLVPVVEAFVTAIEREGDTARVRLRPIPGLLGDL